eukprot:6346616-Prymnesium_polylepis.1
MLVGSAAPRPLQAAAEAVGVCVLQRLGSTALGSTAPDAGSAGRAIEPLPPAASTVGADGGGAGGGGAAGGASGGAELGPLLHGNQLRLLWCATLFAQ